MKISIKYSILTIFTILHLTGCNKDNTVEPVIPPIITPLPVTITGHIYGDSIPLEGAVLTMDSLMTITDTSGYYVFADVTGDTFHIAVSHPEFGAYEQDVYRENPNVQDINLTRTHYDYFPLNTGNKWRFSYTSGGYAGSPTSGYTSWSEGGTIRWEIKTKKFVAPNWEYTVSESYYDSSGVIVHDTTFSLVYSTNKNVTVNGWSRILRGGSSFRRYEPISSGETIMYFFIAGGNGDYTLKRKTGLIRFSLSYGGITMGYSSFAELLEFTGH
ncbi:MAG: carboxypeptidase-like regulatory domain-containing protein [Ignavibacteriaceae bacterium]